MDGVAVRDISALWHTIGIVGGVIFYGRFYVQWIASERAGRSVMPLLFWYMSSVGSVLLVGYSVATQSPLGALGQNFNLVVYGRNLIHIWREKGTLTRRRRHLVHGTILLVGIPAIYLLGRVWLSEYQHTQAQPPEVARRVWFWLAIGAVGQALFAARFLLQWAATEMKRRSVVPPAFWYLSLLASALQAATFFQRREWVFAIGMAATIVIYLRNIWLVRKAGDEGQEASA